MISGIDEEKWRMVMGEDVVYPRRSGIDAIGEEDGVDEEERQNGDDDRASDDRPATSSSLLKKSLSPHLSRSFTSLLCILSYVHTQLLSNKTSKIREVYYFYATWFKVSPRQYICNSKFNTNINSPPQKYI